MIVVLYLANMKSMAIISAVDILLPVCLPSIPCVAAHWRTSVADRGMQAVLSTEASLCSPDWLQPHKS